MKNNMFRWPAVALLSVGLAGCGGFGPIEVAAGGICGLIYLVLQLIAIVEIAGSTRILVSKLLWILVILCAPLLGLLIYYLAGR